MSARERAEGFRKVARESAAGAGVSCELFGEYTAAHGRAAIKRILDEHSEVTGVFAASDEILIGMLEVLRDRRRRVGIDISVVTFDDVEPLALLDPPVTAVRQLIDEMGRTAVGLITVALAGAPQVETVRIPVELVVRGSVGPPKRARGDGSARNIRPKPRAKQGATA
jgi:LacI family transcriptional regulator